MNHKKIIDLLDKFYLKSTVHKIVNSLHSHQKSEQPDIFIFSTPRSGSTLLFDLIALNPKIKAITEPLNKGRKENLAPYIKNPRWRYASLNLQEEEGLRQYFDYLMYKKMSNCLMNTDQHHWFTNRCAIKCLRAPGIIEWFRKNFNMQAIYLTRHPIPSALSRIRNGWNLKGNDKNFPWFYEAEYYQENVLTPKIKSLIETKQKNGSVLDLQIIMWCLENVKVLRNMQKYDNITFLTYEELTMESEGVIDFLSNHLKLPNISAMRKAINKPSNSSKHSKEKTHTAIKNRDRSYLLEKWKSKVNENDLKNTFEILDEFGIDLYKRDSIFPNAKYTKFLG